MATETYEYQSDFTRRLEHRGEARGQAEGRAAMLLRILAARGSTCPPRVVTGSPRAPISVSSTRGATGH